MSGRMRYRNNFLLPPWVNRQQLSKNQRKRHERCRPESFANLCCTMLQWVRSQHHDAVRYCAWDDSASNDALVPAGSVGAPVETGPAGMGKDGRDGLLSWFFAGPPGQSS
eukprot:3404597-Amphidinium_carterae.2